MDKFAPMIDDNKQSEPETENKYDIAFQMVKKF